MEQEGEKGKTIKGRFSILPLPSPVVRSCPLSRYATNEIANNEIDMDDERLKENLEDRSTDQ
jgi:hypothetical protein